MKRCDTYENILISITEIEKYVCICVYVRYIKIVLY